MSSSEVQPVRLSRLLSLSKGLELHCSVGKYSACRKGVICFCGLVVRKFSFRKVYPEGISEGEGKKGMQTCSDLTFLSPSFASRFPWQWVLCSQLCCFSSCVALRSMAVLFRSFKLSLVNQLLSECLLVSICLLPWTEYNIPGAVTAKLYRGKLLAFLLHNVISLWL